MVSPALLNPYSEKVFHDCIVRWGNGAAHSMLARSVHSNKGRIHLRRSTCHSLFACGMAADHTFRVADHADTILKPFAFRAVIRHRPEGVRFAHYNAASEIMT